MPLEIIIDTRGKRGVLKLDNLRRIEEFEQKLSHHPDMARPLSVVEFVKAARQSFYNNPDFYSLPTNSNKNFVLLYLKNTAGNNRKDSANTGAKLVNSFVDPTEQKLRISLKIAGLGSYRMDTLLNNYVAGAIRSSFGDTNFEVRVTGTTSLFAKGIEYLKGSLTSSLVTAIVVIAVMIAALFRNGLMIMIALIPNVVVLILTGGLMGLLGISLKPTTSLIFSLFIGIIIDSSTHFLAHYRQEILYKRLPLRKAVAVTLMETGPSIIYMSLMLFAGFVIFVWSDFGGTRSLGILMSLSMLIALVTNLTLLPALLNSFDKGKVRRGEEG
jgi:predicted RND superfamily exporter protein